jgi:hypothetical protein
MTTLRDLSVHVYVLFLTFVLLLDAIVGFTYFVGSVLAGLNAL